jgi:hypothetical protein
MTTTTNSIALQQTLHRIEDFFYNEPELPWRPLPKHLLRQSPCYPIIKFDGNFYYCIIHPNVWNIHLESIEHHCKYKEPEKHKAVILIRIKNIDSRTTKEVSGP